HGATMEVKIVNTSTPDRTHPRPPTRAVIPQIQRMFPCKSMEDLTPDQQFSVKKEDGLAARALNPSLQSFVFMNLKTGESRETGFQDGDLNHLQFNAVDASRRLYCHDASGHQLVLTWNHT